ncbi:MAG: MCP four helix bundle domain-containing protein, partial [Campylobacterales bacterium]|nr:MCP four helix bundle domain-containing protein [Campylobacterales bacterium]
MKWLDNMVLQSKLILLTGVMMLALGLLGYMGYKATSSWESDVTYIGSGIVPSLVNCGTMRNGVQIVTIQINRTRGLRDHPQLKDKMADASTEMQKGFDRIDKGMKGYLEAPSTEDEKVAWESFLPEYEQWRKKSEVFKVNVIDPLARTDDPAQIDALFGKMTAHIESSSILSKSMQEKLQKVYDINKKNIANASDRAKEQSSSYKQMFITVVLVSLIFAIILSTLIIRSITRAISESVSSIRDGAMQITSASDQVASSSSSLAQGASEQASSVEEVSATLEESTAINTQNTDNARQADILAKNAND